MWSDTTIIGRCGEGTRLLVKLLLARGKVDVDSKDNFGQRPLSLAAEKGHEAVVKLLRTTGKADVDSKAYPRSDAAVVGRRGREHEAAVITHTSRDGQGGRRL